LEAVKAAITVLEDDPVTNCGYGSNLTNEGCVEGDASVMDGKTLIYGGCGAVKSVKNPIHLAYDICVKQLEPLPLGLVPPSFLVGRGGVKYAKAAGLKTVKQKSLISAKALSQYKKYKNLVESNKTEELLDTVGAVCVDNDGHVAAGCSSGLTIEFFVTPCIKISCRGHSFEASWQSRSGCCVRQWGMGR
jgi:taspase (threonine aspartase 1)